MEATSFPHYLEEGETVDETTSRKRPSEILGQVHMEPAGEVEQHSSVSGNMDLSSFWTPKAGSSSKFWTPQEAGGDMTPKDGGDPTPKGGCSSDFWTPNEAGGDIGGGGGGVGDFPLPDEVWMAALDSFDKRLSKVEKFLNIGAVEDGDTLESKKRDQKPSKTISRDEMLAVMIDAITHLGTTEFGIGKSLMRRYVSERLGIDFANSQYYNKKLNTLIRFGLDQKLFTFDKKNQLFKL